MTAYTPSTEIVRQRYTSHIYGYGADFDSWLTSYRLSVIDEVEDYLVRRDQFTERTLSVIDELR